MRDDPRSMGECDVVAPGALVGSSCTSCFACTRGTSACGGSAFYWCARGGSVNAEYPAACDAGADAGAGCAMIPPSMGDCDTVAPGMITGSPCTSCFACTRGPNACGGSAFFWCMLGGLHSEAPAPCDAGEPSDAGL